MNRLHIVAHQYIGRALGALVSIIFTLTGVFLIMFAVNLTDALSTDVLGLDFAIWAAIGLAGLVLGTLGILAGISWVLSERARSRSQH